MFSTYYDSLKIYSSAELWILILILFSFLFSIFYLRRIYHNIFGFQPKVNYWFVTAFFTLLLLVKIQSVAVNYFLMKEIKSGNFLVVEGVINEYNFNEARSRDEWFTISGVNFKYNSHGTRKVFFANRNPGRIELENGLVARVSYVEYGGSNLIFKFELKF